MRMNSNLKSKIPFKYIFLCFSMAIVFWLISFFEIASKIYSGIKIPNIGLLIGYKIINDFITVLITSLLILPVYFLLQYSIKIRRDTIIKILFTLIITVQFALTKYHLTTLVNLGADFLGYSNADMYTTVSASEKFSILYFVPFIVFPLLFWSINNNISKKINNKTLFLTLGSLTLICIGFKLINPQVSDNTFQNKLSFFINDIIRFHKEKKEFNCEIISYKNEFPLLKNSALTPDVLEPFFNIKDEKPNIVVIIVEGLGTEFIGENEYRGFTPYLDNLIPKSLYWKNFVSNAGRTFGSLPSILGSLPYGEKGFLELKPIPFHSSLISILKSNGYNTSFYCGDKSNFDNRINFLDFNSTDHVIDIDKFGSDYKMTNKNSGGFTWGYPDAEIFRKTLSEINTKKEPRLDIIMTLTNHEPFDFPEKAAYLKKVDQIINTNKNIKLSKSNIESNKNIYASLLYTDNSIRNFIESYAKRPDYKNTIFIITGDHRLIPIEQKDKLCRFHVPLYIFSPMLKRIESFKSVSSHWDITPSLVSFLTNNYKMNKIEKTAWMSTGLDTFKGFRNIHTIPIMQNKGMINEIIYKDYLYSDGNLFKIDGDFETTQINDYRMLNIVEQKLLETKKLNAYLTQKNKIIPKHMLLSNAPNFVFTKQELILIKKLTFGLSSEQIFLKARDLAFKENRNQARLLCNYVLNELPNYSDVRTLKGRTLAWDKDYKKAELELLEVVKRTPFYDDSYLALLDVYWWTNEDNKGIALIKKAMKNNITTPELGIKLVRIYQKKKLYKQAKQTLDSLLKIHPNNTACIKLKKEFK